MPGETVEGVDYEWSCRASRFVFEKGGKHCLCRYVLEVLSSAER